MIEGFTKYREYQVIIVRGGWLLRVLSWLVFITTRVLIPVHHCSNEKISNHGSAVQYILFFRHHMKPNFIIVK